ncbi:hypothetical protein PsorP6_016982 [Peronosclerospora sorghi]|uniref:Uncharacterized protein n=1 Tax=Peronosclerospora sorghi TaxID=230839 RepID=A0ACC0WFK6_9STRA|nr:hypothetical protein PsorP6_016982 [Peronosclerospora sorghi]
MGDIIHAHPALFCRPPASARDLEEEKARQEAALATKDEQPTEDRTDDVDPGKETATIETAKAIGGWSASLDEKVQAYLKELAP